MPASSGLKYLLSRGGGPCDLLDLAICVLRRARGTPGPEYRSRRRRRRPISSPTGPPLGGSASVVHRCAAPADSTSVTDPPGAGLPDVLPTPVPPPANSNRQERQRVAAATGGSPRGPTRPRTGLNALKARVKVRGLAAIDKRTAAARALLDWRRELLVDLRGAGPRRLRPSGRWSSWPCEPDCTSITLTPS